MSPKRQGLILVAVAVLAMAGGYFLADSLSQPTAREPLPTATAAAFNSPEELLGKAAPGFQLTGPDGRSLSLSDFEDKVLLLNFWATWCAPCVEEMPMLSELAAVHEGAGLTVLGVAVDDPEKAREFVSEMNLAYPIAVGTAQNAVTNRAYGNRSGMLPYSVLIDRQGIVRWAFPGRPGARRVADPGRGIALTLF